MRLKSRVSIISTLTISGDPDDPQTNINRLENLSRFLGVWPRTTASIALSSGKSLRLHAPNQAHLPVNLLPKLVRENEDPDLHNFHTQAEISLGQVIQLTTDDPTTRSLPDPTLVSLHAAISQVIRMAGRAGIPEWEYEDSEDEREPQHNSCAMCRSTPATHPKPQSQAPQIRLYLHPNQQKSRRSRPTHHALAPAQSDEPTRKKSNPIE
ncbi:MAG: hypothetical protein M1840_002217 [Geoglossum simile]|nr:MAG: hypothetical protein M1840_002217 [Geoglossum simile]